MILLIVVIQFKNDTNEFIYKTEIDSQTQKKKKKKHGYQRKKGGGEINWVWDWHIHTTIYKIDNPQRPNV